MSTFISDDHWCTLWAESYAKRIQPDPWDPKDSVYRYPHVLGSGYKRDISLPSGVSLTLHHCVYSQSIKSEVQEGPRGLLEFCFYINGEIEWGDGTLINQAQHYLIGYFNPNKALVECYGQPMLVVDVHLDPELLQSWIGERLEDLPQNWQRMMTGSSEQLLSPVQPTTSAMQTILHQILGCPFVGATKQIFLEGKVLELLALQIDALAPKRLELGNQVTRIEQIHHAKEVLDQNLMEPPSLADLARLVGLNDCSLKKGFRQIIGTTVFGYVHQRRMEQARQLLESSKLTVEGVAGTVGYSHLASFSKAFSKQFGISPKKYQQMHRR